MYDDTTSGSSAPANTDRPVKRAMYRGWRRRCPKCGKGPILRGYLTVRSACPVCGEDLTPQRTDDGPAYLTILIVGHILVPPMGVVYMEYNPDPLIVATVFSVAAVAMCLYLLPRLKGAMVGLQWAKRMGGFENS